MPLKRHLVCRVLIALGTAGLIYGQTAAPGVTGQGADELQAAILDSLTGKSTPGAGAAAPAQSVSTAYQPSPEVSDRALKQFVDWVRTSSNAKEADQLAAVFKQHNPVQVWTKIVESDGLKPNDLADSLTAYWILNWLIANGASDTNREQALAVRGQVGKVFASRPSFNELDNETKQETSEVLILNFLVQHAAYSQAMKNNDAGLKAKLADAAQQRFQAEMKVDLQSLLLTPAGFRPKNAAPPQTPATAPPNPGTEEQAAAPQTEARQGGWRRASDPPAPDAMAEQKPAAVPFTPPRNWVVEPKEHALSIRPTKLGSNQKIEVEVYNPEPASGDLTSFLKAHLKSPEVPDWAAVGCKAKQRRPVEVSCTVTGAGGDHFFYALQTKDGQHRFVHVLVAPNSMASLPHLMGIKRVMDNAEAGQGRVDVPSTEDALTNTVTEAMAETAVAPSVAPAPVTEPSAPATEETPAGTLDPEPAPDKAAAPATAPSAAPPVTSAPQAASGDLLPGLKWNQPEDFARADNEESVCPWACVAYKGPFVGKKSKSNQSPSFWPMIVVSEARPGSAASVLGSYVEAIGLLPKVKILEKRPAEANTILVRTKDEDRSREIWRLITAVERSGASVPLEIAAFDEPERIEGRRQPLAQLAASLRVDTATVSSNAAPSKPQVGGGPDTGARVYVAGVFGHKLINGIAMSDIEWNYLTLASDGTACLCLPPAGMDNMAPTRFPVKDKGSWAKQGDILVLQFPRKPTAEERSWRLVAAGRGLDWVGGKRPGQYMDGGWRELKPLQPQVLAGTWIKGSYATPPMPSYSGQVFVASANNSKFVFREDGSYSRADRTSVAVMGENVGGGSNKGKDDGGRWKLEGWTLRLSGQEGERSMIALDQRDQNVTWINIDGEIFERPKR